ncbi:sulfotransferase family protein [Stakelama saccharophila]|uniref:Sulfotransferase n=1 Tax=Stakelama saccharophila TaxID=3075605 RepID=A0ABZ0BCF2_9SPHN|nr:sulfotransferase [Stakelama sp. W311]WNO54745.1 sulfotransferase [Stakelama sp. W311]
MSTRIRRCYSFAMKAKVFGIGLNKTGTTTLGQCLAQLGYRHMGYRPDLLRALYDGRTAEIFAEIDRYDSFEDWPYPLMYRELAVRYPDAKFILTVRRDPDVWLKSLRRHSLRSRPFRHARKIAYGYNYPHSAPDAHRDIYCRHNREVCEYLGDRVRVLCWERGDGWPELCGYLGCDMPDELFPHANAAAELPIRRAIPNRILQQLEAWNLALSLRLQTLGAAPSKAAPALDTPLEGTRKPSDQRQ